MPRNPPPPPPEPDLSFEPTGVDDGVTAGPSTDEAAAPAAQVGRDTPSIGKVDRFDLKSVLGKGGLGTVYAAWDRYLSRMVALKTLHVDADPADREALDVLFLEEARAAAGLSHPHIVTVFEAGSAETGIYIAMERLQGDDLRHMLKRTRLTPVESAQVACRVAEALAYAHSQKVIHCDIKPANIFMTERTHPKVLDFGIARVAHREVPALEGMTAGSPYYLSPEQLEGRAVDARTDVYSLGVVLYELLTGRKPFEGGGLEEIIHAVKTAEVVPPHRGSPTLPIKLSEITTRAMARDPASRHPSASELATDLRDWLASADSPGNGDTAAAATAETGKSRRGVLAIAGLAGVVVIAGVLAWLKLGGQPSAATAAAPAASAVAAGAPASVQVAEAAPSAAAVLPAAPASIAAPPEPAPSSPSALAAPEPVPAVPAKAAAASKPVDRGALGRAEAARRRQASAVATGKPVPAVVAPAEGTVQLAVTPWGQVEVDGKPMGTAPPLARLTLSSGNHTITVRNADFPPYSATVNVAADSPVVFQHRFGP